MAISYTYQQIQTIQQSGISYQLPEHVLAIIQTLDEQIQQTLLAAAPEQQHEKPVRKHFEKIVHPHPSRRAHHHPRVAKQFGLGGGMGGGVSVGAGGDENWNTGKSIKMTPKLVNENSDKTMNEIRAALNKLSPKNIDAQREIIIENIRSVIECEDAAAAESTEKIAQMIFDIASSNKFMSELYAQLFKELTEIFDMFRSRLENLFETYKTSLNEIFYVNPNDDYNNYCKYTKTNDVRKALTTFIVNLMKQGVLEAELVFDMTQHMISTVFRYAAEENRTNEVEEITENLFILMSQSDAELNHYEIWTDVIIPKIHELSKLRKTEGAKYPSMTNRASFKYMDILDNLH